MSLPRPQQDECLFRSCDLDKYMRDKEDEVQRKIEMLDRNIISSADAGSLSEKLFKRHAIEPVELHQNQVQMLQPENVEIDISQNSRIDIDDRLKNPTFSGTRFTFVVPYSGNSQLLKLKPNQWDQNPPRGEVFEGSIHLNFDLRPHQVDDKRLKEEAKQQIESIQQYVGWCVRQVGMFNMQLEGRIRGLVQSRIDSLRHDNAVVAAIGFPVVRREDADTTFPNPQIRERAQLTLPQMSTSTEEREKGISYEDYKQILYMVQSMGIVFERSPTTFKKMQEEDLRTIILVALNAQFKGQATGETFNAQGKTDILIKCGEVNVFIAECKIWRGKKEIEDAIDQLLGYVSWRDTKTAIIIFSRNTNLSAVVKTTDNAVRGHPKFKRLQETIGSTSSCYVLQHPRDGAKEVFVTTLAFDVPR